ncbi:MAG: ferredoxin [Waddliaceae bacterium]|jgi:ferredoxin|nr:ferredoxin [Waddliaceae bacterium]MBT3579137.1 ferredoxin [Waddliaceae bacterium]MBT4444293.1 ferredoxin [Waddliaceae bacterium]MBT6928508.1 ferredoxin [Waddliaceae bacterium]MBT7264846.1 ferredoxin [Waddliaceae bacterium]
MPKASVNPETCIGCGLCENLCPECFKINDDGIAEVIEAGCLSIDFDQLEDTANQCPVNAITVEA